MVSWLFRWVRQAHPTKQPTNQPTKQPTKQPTNQPKLEVQCRIDDPSGWGCSLVGAVENMKFR
ncbi:MAG: hypothetical protein DYG89_07290 [Caldilinea sp. CFX5]|nr:hypothetical protein [Caldilinea sp. CFX5]